MRLLTILFCAIACQAIAQSKIVKETVPVAGQQYLDLDFAFADDIQIKNWDKKEVYVEVSVNIQNGEYNDIFTLESRSTSSSISIEMDRDMWKKIEKDQRGNWNNCWTSEINYTVYAPKGLKISAETISGNFTLTYSGSILNLKTISGDVDITIPSDKGMDFKAKTISGEVFSDIEIDFPHGKEGLRQIVGMNVRGRIGPGGDESNLETISGDIFLRKG